VLEAYTVVVYRPHPSIYHSIYTDHECRSPFAYFFPVTLPPRMACDVKKTFHANTEGVVDVGCGNHSRLFIFQLKPFHSPSYVVL